jgi:hypothetical protein
MEKLDLSSLKSYSPDWPHELRLAVCIATKYAQQRLCQRARATAQEFGVSSGSESGSGGNSASGSAVGGKDEGDSAELNEDGTSRRQVKGETAPAGAESSSTTSRAETEKQRKELVESWEEFASKVGRRARGGTRGGLL